MAVYKDEKQTLGKSITVLQTGRAKSTSLQNEAFQPNVRLLRGNESSKIRWKLI